jgi:hypothetical protein
MTSKDAAGNTKNVLSAVTVDLSDGAASGGFFSDNGCATGITQTSVALSTSSVTVYYKDNIGETITLSAADSSAGLSTGTLTVTAGPDRLALAANTTFNAGSCQAITVTTKDTASNTKAVLTNTTVALTDGAASGTFYSDNVCGSSITQTSIASGDSTSTVYYSNTTSESITLGASDAATVLATANLNVTAGPDRFILTGNATFKSGTCQTFTVTTKDAAGNTANALILGPSRLERLCARSSGSPPEPPSPMPTYR